MLIAFSLKHQDARERDGGRGGGGESESESESEREREWGASTRHDRSLPRGVWVMIAGRTSKDAPLSNKKSTTSVLPSHDAAISAVPCIIICILMTSSGRNCKYRVQLSAYIRGGSVVR